MECVQTLTRAGISRDDAIALRRIAMTLHRWHELECGDSNESYSWSLVRGRKTPRVFSRDPQTQAPVWTGGDFIHDELGAPFLERHSNRPDENGKCRAYWQPVPDREKGARKRLAAIMARYPGFQAYVQTDPRGAALYILRPGDVPPGADPDCYYSRGLAVYK